MPGPALTFYRDCHLNGFAFRSVGNRYCGNIVGTTVDRGLAVCLLKVSIWPQQTEAVFCLCILVFLTIRY